MGRIRWAAVLFAVVQVLTFYRPYPPGVRALAFTMVVVLVVGNAVLLWALRRGPTGRELTALAVASLLLDVVVVIGLTVVYTFDPETAIWALVYVLPLEGAILFQRRGALGVTAVAAVGYALREVYGALVYGHPLLLTSISFRMGLAFIIAAVAGAMAASLMRERDELAAMAEQLRVANEVKDDFVAMTNHELRTPLTTILGYASLLEERWDAVGEERRRAFATAIAQQSRRLQVLVEDLLTFSSSQAGALHLDVREVAVAPIVDQAIATAGKGEGLTQNACPADLWVRADPNRLAQIVTNYVSNAHKYGAPPVVVDGRVEGDDMVLTVADAGAGVPEDFVPRLFDEFSQASHGTSRTAAGTGLGLAIVQRLAQAQGGSVWYEPAPGGGARFCLRLPGATAPAGPGATAPAGAPPAATRAALPAAGRSERSPGGQAAHPAAEPTPDPSASTAAGPGPAGPGPG